MKIFVTEEMIRRMTQRQENGQTADVVILTAMIQARGEMWTSLGKRVEETFNYVAVARA